MISRNRRIKTIQHGHWAKKKTLKPSLFKEVPDLSEEDLRKEINDKLKPYSLDLSKHIPIIGKGAVGPSGPPPPSYDPDAQSFFTAVEGGGDTLTTTEKDAVNDLVLDLKANSLWSLYDGFYPFVGGTASSHKWNLLDPQDTDAAYRIRWIGGMTHSSTGILGNGSNSVGETYWNGVSESATEISLGVYINDKLDLNPTNDYDFGAYVSTPVAIDGVLILGYNNKTTKYVNFYRTAAKSTSSGSYTNGLLLGQNNGATTQLYQDDTQLISTSQTLSNPNYNWGIGASLRDIGGLPTGIASSRRGYGTAFIGQTYLNQTQITALNTALVDFNTALSRN